MKKVLVIILAVIAVAAIVFAVVLNNDKQKLNAEMTALTEENTALKKAADDLEQQAEKSVGEKEELTAKVKAAEDSAVALKEQLDKLTAENKQLTEKLAGAEEAAKAASEEAKGVGSIADALEGVFKENAADEYDAAALSEGGLKELFDALTADAFLDGEGLELPEGIEDIIAEYAAALAEAYALIG